MKKTLESQSFNMGTVIINHVTAENSQQVLREAEAEINRLNRLLSRFLEESDISRINHQAGVSAVKVSEETFQLLSESLVYSKVSRGLWDITICPLVTLWEEAKKQLTVPSQQMIEKDKQLVDFNSVILNEASNEVFLSKEKQAIDLGGIGKGYAADQIIQLFKKHQIASAFTNFGGNVSTLGTKPDGTPWNIGIQHPRNTQELIGLVPVIDKTIVTSGDYQRFFQATDGKKYHHIIDPKTGYPSDSGLISATIIAKSSTTADALSTITFLAGLEKSKAILKDYEGVEAVLIDKHLTVYLTKGIKDDFEGIQGLKIRVLEL
ncbi:MAG: FAD:protein FMN transferase [Thermotogota bacterium]|nr:FAD:protein FMN transferase [Thermotogota bacterium]